MNDDADKLSMLWDREQIKDLPKKYCHFVRTKDIVGVLELYAEDCIFDMPNNMMAEGGVWTGKKAIEKTFEDNVHRLDPWPFTHNHVIELISSTRAKGFVYAEFRMGSANMRVTNVGCYEDEYVKEDEKWKFFSRKLRSVEVPAASS